MNAPLHVHRLIDAKHVFENFCVKRFCVNAPRGRLNDAKSKFQFCVNEPATWRIHAKSNFRKYVFSKSIFSKHFFDFFSRFFKKTCFFETIFEIFVMFFAFLILRQCAAIDNFKKSDFIVHFFITVHS